MKPDPVTLRIAVPEDAAALLEIYAPYVRNTAVTFEYDVPSEAEFSARIRSVLERYPYLVAQRGSALAGYAYAAPFKERAAYDWAVETTVYVAESAKGAGIGRRLYGALEQCLAAQGILNLNACIAYPPKEDAYLTQDSAAFHAHMGYTQAGMFRQCGYKFDRWYDMIWMEKHIGIHTTPAPAVLPFPEVRQQALAALGIQSGGWI